MHDIVDPEEAYLSAWRAGYREGFMKTGHLMQKSILDDEKPLVTTYFVAGMVSFAIGVTFGVVIL